MYIYCFRNLVQPLFSLTTGVNCSGGLRMFGCGANALLSGAASSPSETSVPHQYMVYQYCLGDIPLRSDLHRGFGDQAESME